MMNKVFLTLLWGACPFLYAQTSDSSSSLQNQSQLVPVNYLAPGQSSPTKNIEQTALRPVNYFEPGESTPSATAPELQTKVEDIDTAKKDENSAQFQKTISENKADRQDETSSGIAVRKEQKKESGFTKFFNDLVQKIAPPAKPKTASQNKTSVAENQLSAKKSSESKIAIFFQKVLAIFKPENQTSDLVASPEKTKTQKEVVVGGNYSEPKKITFLNSLTKKNFSNNQKKTSSATASLTQEKRAVVSSFASIKPSAMGSLEEKKAIEKTAISSATSFAATTSKKLVPVNYFAPGKSTPINKSAVSKEVSSMSRTSKLAAIDRSEKLAVATKAVVASLIPRKKGSKFGFVDQKGITVINPEYSNVGFFAEDCRLTHSPIENIRKFGTNEYASVLYNGENYRIDQQGNRVYHFNNQELGKCPSTYKKQIYQAVVQKDLYGVVESAKFYNAADPSQYKIYPEYQLLHVLEGNDYSNPMIIAVKNDKFGVVDINNNVIIPFEYADIKRNFSWKLASLFEVTKDGKSYFFVDNSNKTY